MTDVIFENLDQLDNKNDLKDIAYFNEFVNEAFNDINTINRINNTLLTTESLNVANSKLTLSIINNIQNKYQLSNLVFIPSIESFDNVHTSKVSVKLTTEGFKETGKYILEQLKKFVKWIWDLIVKAYEWIKNKLGIKDKKKKLEETKDKVEEAENDPIIKEKIKQNLNKEKIIINMDDTNIYLFDKFKIGKKELDFYNIYYIFKTIEEDIDNYKKTNNIIIENLENLIKCLKSIDILINNKIISIENVENIIEDLDKIPNNLYIFNGHSRSFLSSNELRTSVLQDKEILNIFKGINIYKDCYIRGPYMKGKYLIFYPNKDQDLSTIELVEIKNENTNNQKFEIDIFNKNKTSIQENSLTSIMNMLLDVINYTEEQKEYKQNTTKIQNYLNEIINIYNKTLMNDIDNLHYELNNNDKLVDKINELIEKIAIKYKNYVKITSIYEYIYITNIQTFMMYTDALITYLISQAPININRIMYKTKLILILKDNPIYDKYIDINVKNYKDYIDELIDNADYGWYGLEKNQPVLKTGNENNTDSFYVLIIDFESIEMDIDYEIFSINDLFNDKYNKDIVIKTINYYKSNFLLNDIKNNLEELHLHKLKAAFYK